jgi:hypothetical protein
MSLKNVGKWNKRYTNYINDRFIKKKLFKYLPNCLKLTQFADFTRNKYCEEAPISRTWNEHKNILKI